MAASHLIKAEEREVISQMFVAGKSSVEIAQALHRHRTTISREFKRNGYKGLYMSPLMRNAAPSDVACEAELRVAR